MYPLSLPQEAIYLDALKRGSSTKFNMSAVCLIRGPLDPLLFRKSLEFAHEALDVRRMRLHLDGETVMQEFLPVKSCPCPFLELDFSTHPDPFESTIEWVLNDFSKPMLLHEFPMHSDVLIRLSSDLYFWYPKFHHIANDGFGQTVVHDTVTMAYNALLHNNCIPEFTKHSYIDFLEEDRAYLSSEQFRKDEIFWKNKFQSMPEPLPFTSRKASLGGDHLHTERLTLSVNRQVYDSTVKQCQDAGVTPSQLLLACLFAYLNRVTGQVDIVIGTPILNRSNHAFRRTVGLFMGMMPLRISIDRDESLFTLASRIKSETRACYRHQRFPLGEILRQCRMLEGFCLGIFDVTFVYRKLNFDVFFGASSMRAISLDPGLRDETLSIEVDEYNEEEPVNIFFNYNPLLLSKVEAGQMAWAFEKLFDDVAMEVDPLVRNIRLSPEPLQSAVIHDEAVSSGQSVPDMIGMRVIEAPDALAVVSGEARLTYGEMDRLAGCIASFLSGPCATVAEQVVAVFCERSCDWIIAMLGILKAGCTYLPLDPETPRERLEFILHDSGCHLMLVDELHSEEKFDSVLSIPIGEAARYTKSTPVSSLTSASSLAYIIYTSGTTGVPKGVMIEHGGLANTIIDVIFGWEITSHDRVLAFASPMFDASIIEYFLALASGGTLVIASKKIILDSARFIDFLLTEQVTVAMLSPTYLSALGHVDLKSLRLLGTAGEAANPSDVAYHVKHLTFVNAYGPTETSILACYLKLEAGTEFSADRVPIGKVMEGVRILILDEELHPLPIGAVGELCIGGRGLARGYVGHPELTADRFVINPLNKGERLYRTGDLGRILPDGNIEFNGRRDRQVKIRGYRVELDEIETVLKTHPMVETAVVIKLIDCDSLVAYVVIRNEFEPHELRRFLASKIPAYMIPNSWVRIETLPLNTSGKVDFDVLPAPTAEEEFIKDQSASVPLTDMEKSLVEIWSEILHVPAVGLEDDFFMLGGHSLNAIRMMTRIQNHFGIRIEMSDFFDNPTVSGLAAMINRKEACCDPLASEVESPDKSLSEPELMAQKENLLELIRAAAINKNVSKVSKGKTLSSLQERLWLVQQLERESTAYIVPLHMIIRGSLETDTLKKAIRKLWMRHDALRTVFPVIDGEPKKNILTPEALEIYEYDFCDTKKNENWQDHYLANHAEAFRLEEGPLIRVCLYILATDEHALLFDIHHINADGVSLEIIREELFSIYDALIKGRTPDLPTPGVSYDEYVAYETKLRESTGYRQKLDARIKELSGVPTYLDFLFDKQLPKKFTYRGNLLVNKYDDLLLHNCLVEIGKTAGLTPFMVYLAAFGALLHLYTGQDELLVGIPASLRKSEGFEHTVGFFVNTCIARLDFSGKPSLLEVMKRTGKAVRDMFRAHEVSLDHLVQALCKKRTLARPPLVQASLSYMMNDSVVTPAANGLSVELIYVSRRSSMFELTMDILMHKNGGICTMEYASDAWQEKSIHRMYDHFQIILGALVDNQNVKLDKINLMPSGMRESVENLLHSDPLESAECLIPEQIRDHARNKPEASAIISGGSTTSYAQLDSLVSRCRSGLIAFGLHHGTVMVFALQTGLEWVVSALAAMTEGIVVVPIATDIPLERLHHILNNSGATFLLYDDEFVHASEWKHPSCRLINCKDMSDKILAEKSSSVKPEETAYIIYTSGTTGRPKGVCVSHGAFEAHCRSAVQAYGLTPEDRTLAFAPMYFDASWEQIFAILLAGGSVLIRDTHLWAPDEWCRQVSEFGVSCVDIPAQYLRELLFYWNKYRDFVPTSLRMVICGGEAMPVSLAQAWLAGPLDHIPLINAYGPTEAVVTSTFNRIGKESRLDTASGIVPIGKPMPGRVLRILDANGMEVGVGIVGELCIGGSCLSEGYQSDKFLTELSFRFWCPSSEGGRWAEKESPEAIRLYRTGDRVRIGPDDLIEFLGRLDRQLKIRGFRIEPSEIEAILVRHTDIDQAFVTEFYDERAGKSLVAYCVPAGKTTPSQDKLVDWLSQWLPEHMIPASLTFVPKFPLTANDKIDVSALPYPEIIRPFEASSALIADELEEKIARIWADVLGREDVGLNENFFDIGGHSILLVRVHTRLQSELGISIPLVELFAYPSVASIARRVRGESSVVTGRTMRTRKGDVAVIGMAGRFPGAANIEELWDNLVKGRESIRFFTQEELAAEGVPSIVREKPDYVPAHGFMDGTKLFDADFFGYTPKEAEILDPQQRIFLEESWHALENAGYDPDRFKGDIGVFAGIGMNLYLLNNLEPLLRKGYGVDSYAISLANDKDFITTRVSYKLNLRGPSVNINTACSTSLVAIHMAAGSLLSDECDIALAGGVTLQPSISGYAYQSEGIASPDGHCRAFADDAAGTVGGSGAAVVVLKRLENALADGDTIHAVIKGSAINNDGADKVGFTAPGVNRQRDVIRTALDSAGISARNIHYIEAHGTGTPIGDPIEIQALTEAFSLDQPQAGQCYIGSIKSNIGHLDTAAGVAGFIKTTLALEHGLIPPTLHCDCPSKRIEFDHTPFRVAQKLTPWPGDEPRRAGVSSFGMGGTNAHIVLEEAPKPHQIVFPKQNIWCFPISARSKPSLLAFAEKLAMHLEQFPDLDALDIWFTLAEGRHRFAMRTVLMADSRERAVAALRSLTDKDILHTDRDGKVMSGTGNPQELDFRENLDFAPVRNFAKVWLSGNLEEASRFLPQEIKRRIPLPSYVFEHKLYWVESQLSDSKKVEKQSDSVEKREIGEWFYFPGWEHVPMRHSADTFDGSILLIHDGSVVAQRWEDTLRRAGISFITCQSGEGLGVELSSLDQQNEFPAYCWYLTALSYEPGCTADYSVRLDLLLSDVRSLATTKGDRQLQLMLFSPQYISGPDAPPTPSFAYLEAASAVIPYEYPDIVTHLLYLDPLLVEDSSLNAACLIGSLPSRDKIFVFSNGKLWKRTSVKFSPESSVTGMKRLVERGVYLITGGFGGIGLTLAGYLARTCNARLVLLSRHESDLLYQKDILALQKDGAEVWTVSIDIADGVALRSVVDEVCSSWGGIDGVIHAAGVPGGSLIARTRLEDIKRVVHAKVQGSTVLAEALIGREPSFVLLCSSLTASVGGLGQVAYAAGNAWLDAFAAAQSVLQPGIWLSVQWDSWSDVGMAARAIGKGGEIGDNGKERKVLREWVVSPDSFWPWGEHIVNGVAMLPGTAYLEMFLQAIQTQAGPIEIDNITLSQPLIYSGESLRRVQVLSEGDDIILQSDDGLTLSEHARARIALSTEPPPFEMIDAIETIKARCTENADLVYQKNQDVSSGMVIEVQSRWKTKGKYMKGYAEALSWLELPEEFISDFVDHPLHPALLDVAISYYISFVEEGLELMPWRYEKLTVFFPLVQRIISHIILRHHSERMLVFDVDIYDELEYLLVRVEGYTLLRLGSGDEVNPPSRKSAMPENPYAMTPSEGIEVFLHSLATTEPLLCISTVDWQYADRPVILLDGNQNHGQNQDKESPLNPRPAQNTPFREARTESEMFLAQVWGEVLGYDGLGIDDDLIGLGADSLSALQASARIEELTGCKLSIERFFTNSTIAYLAENIQIPAMHGTQGVVTHTENWEEGEL